MKKTATKLILLAEIIAICILHAIKMNQASVETNKVSDGDNHETAPSAQFASFNSFITTD